MNDSTSELIKKYFLEPLGWLTMVSVCVLYIISNFFEIHIENIINVSLVVITIVGLFSFSLSRLLKRFSIKTQRIISRVSFDLLIIDLIILCYIFIKNFQGSQYVQKSFQILYQEQAFVLLILLYIFAFIGIAIDKNLKEIDTSEELFFKIEEREKKTETFIFFSVSIFIVLFIGIYLRINQLYDLSFWVDESTSVLVAQQVIEGNSQTLLNGEIYGRAMVYHEYLARFMQAFNFLGLNTSTRLANIPFYLFIFFGIYFFGKYLYNRRAGLIASILFAFSWISISMFREARFYEIFTATFILFCFYLIYLGNILSEKGILHGRVQDVPSKIYSNISRILFVSILILFFGWLSYNTQPFFILVLYPLLLGSLLIMLFRSFKHGLQLSIFFFFLIVAGVIYTYGDSFQWINIVKAPQPEWKLLIGDVPFDDFFITLIKNQYAYLSAVLVLSIPALIYSWNKKIIFTFALAIGWYSIISLQGYGAEAIRYYYPALPFIVLIVAIVFETYLSKIKWLPEKIALTGIVLLIIGITAYGGYTESNSIVERNSFNRVKNTSQALVMDYLISTGQLGKAYMLTDRTLSMNFYLVFNKAPDFTVLDTDFNQFEKGRTEKYTASKQIDYREINNLRRPVYFAFEFNSTRMSDNFIPYLKSIGGEKVFDDRNRLVYYFPAASSTATTTPNR